MSDGIATATSKARSYTLGPLPWSEETLTKAYWNDFSKTQLSIKEHPGRDLYKRSLSLQSVLRIFNKAAASFLQNVERFHIEAHHGNIFNRNYRDKRRLREDELQEAVYLFASSAMTLVEQSRALCSKIEIPGYSERIDADFASNSRHRFIQELRNDVIHITLHEPNWQLSTNRDGTRITRFLLYAHQLTRADEYHLLARDYLRKNTYGVDLRTLFSEYRTTVNEFHVWLQGAVSSTAGAQISDYRRCHRFITTIGTRAFWRLMLSQVVIQNSKNPYDYLDRYLTETEMEEVSTFPPRSQAQVDRIVEIIDEDGACDDELRTLVYTAFGVL